MSLHESDLVLSEPFYAPSTDGALDVLLSSRETMRLQIAGIATGLHGEARRALDYFLDAAGAKRDRITLRASELLDVPAATAALDSEYWQRAITMTDVFDCMPQARRDEWSKAIQEHKTPEFTAENVVPTFEMLLSSRTQFFAERVDGIFRNLSHAHVTNRPEGFGKRMILQYVLSGGYADHSRAGYINDLRAVIAKFMGRDEPGWNATSSAVGIAKGRSGQWITLDGGALRLRVYRGVGTAHLEVHPDMAWRLNAVLHSLYPSAIPAAFRERPKKINLREFRLMQKPLPFQVVACLNGMEQVRTWATDKLDRAVCTGREPNTLQFPYHADMDKATTKQVHAVLRAIGGVEQERGAWRFDYDPGPIIDEISCSGCLPDQVSHQFYPTPEEIARAAVAAAEIEPGMAVLEPSAGQGGIADHLHPDGLTCVEISALHCQILAAKGYAPVQADFMKWRGGMFDRVVMNPPYSEGRWNAHLHHAASMVKQGGRLVAVLPESARGKPLLDGWQETWGEVYRGAFPGTSVSVSIYVGVKQ